MGRSILRADPALKTSRYADLNEAAVRFAGALAVMLFKNAGVGLNYGV